MNFDSSMLAGYLRDAGKNQQENPDSSGNYLIDGFANYKSENTNASNRSIFADSGNYSLEILDYTGTGTMQEMDEMEENINNLDSARSDDAVSISKSFFVIFQIV